VDVIDDSVLSLQAEGWQTAMKQSRAALEALSGHGDGELTSREWDSMSMSSSEGGAQANGQKPTMEIRASLGEFAIFVSGRVCNNWWPSDGSEVQCLPFCSHTYMHTAC
jgi:hypothetical protein